jgi:hypothetical protein
VSAALAVILASAAGGRAAAAEPGEGAPSIMDMLRAIGEAPAPHAAGATAAGGGGELGPAAEEPEATLIRFDSLLKDGDYDAAKALAKGASGRLGGDAGGILSAAAEFADVFLARHAAMRRAVEVRVGETLTVYTTSGRRRGEVKSASKDGIELTVRTIINGQVRSVKNVTIAWRELSSKEKERLAEDWEPEGPAGDVARAALAVFGKDLGAAERALLMAGTHPLAGHYRLRVAAIREGEAGLAARLAWEKLEAKAGTGRLTPDAARDLLSRMDAYEKAHGKTRFATNAAERIRLTRARAESAMGPYLGLVGHWGFDEGKGSAAADSSSRKNHATLVGTSWAPGVIGNAGSMDGAGHAVVAAADRYNLGTADFTVAAWIKTQANAAILSKAPASGVRDGHAKSLFVSGKRIFFNAGKEWASAGPIVGDGQWHHVAAAFSRAEGRMRFYVDGVSEGSSKMHVPADGPDHVLRIGAGPPLKSGRADLNGAVDEVRIYSRALSADDVTALARRPGVEAPKSAYFPPEEVTATFRPENSMKPYPVGYQQQHFPGYEVDDPTGPFHGKAVYFNQKTGQDALYDVRTTRPTTKITVRMAAMENMTIEVLANIGGAVIGKTGPHGGGNHWAVFEVEFQRPQRGFAIRFHNEISTWLFIDRIFLE